MRHLYRAESLREFGKFEDALAEYQAALELVPDHVEAHQGRQDMMERLGKREQALEEYRRRLDAQPNSANAHFLYGRLLSDLKEKERLYQKAISLDPAHFWAHYGLGYLYERQQKWELSEAHFKKAISIRPRSPEAHHGLGFCFMNQGKDKEAAAAYEAALAIDPNYVESILNLSILDLRKGDYDSAIRRCKRVLELDKDNPWAHNNLGKAYYHQGRYSEAVKEFKAALANPRYDTPQIAYLNLGFAYRRQRELDLAAAAYQKAIEIQPDFAYAFNSLAQVQYHQKKYDEAWKNIRKAQELGYQPPKEFLEALRAAYPQGEPK